MKRPVTILYISSDKDEGLRQTLEAHLSLLEQQGLMEGWHSQSILAGSVEAESREEALKKASLVLLLISADFFASSVCREQMQRALERQQRGEIKVIPILLRRVDGKGALFAHLHPLPSNRISITSWPNQDEAFAEVADGIRLVIENDELPTVNAPHSTLPPVWNIPYTRNPFFLGRDELLTQLHKQLQTGKRMALSQPQAISGLGGIGKTQVAVEYAYRYAQEYQVVLWAQAESQESLISSYVEIASQLKLPEKDEQEQERIIQAVKKWLQTHQDWLLILDNADTLALIPPFLPSALGGHLLLTTRAHAMGRLAQRIEVETMDVEVGALLLLRRAVLINQDAPLEDALPADRALATEISQELGGLPLALDQAGAYIEETQCSLSRYLQIYQVRRESLLKRRGGVDSDHPAPVATTWSLSFEQIEQHNLLAADILRLCAFLAPDAIPEEFLVVEEEKRFEIEEAMAVLGAYSLIRRDREGKTFSVHRLVQVVLRDTFPAEERKHWVELVVQAVNDAFPEVEFINWEACEQYVLHALMCADWIEQEQVVLLEAARLLNHVGMYLNERGRYADTERLYQRAIWICEQKEGEEHSALASSLNNLAVLYRDQGKYKEAERLMMRALDIDEQELGLGHPLTAQSLNNLAELYNAQGKYVEAEPLYRRALEIWEQELGPRHPSTAMSLNNLAALYYAQGKYEEAEPLYQRALEIHEQELGLRHPSTASSLNNLALLYYAQGKYEEAEPLYQRALEIWEQELGLNHPSTALSLNNLAELYRAQGKYIEAEPLYQRALEIWEQELGLNHPSTASSLNNLALLYQAQGKYEEAEPLYQRALEIREQELGLRHPSTASSLNNLAGLYYAQEKYEEAEPLYQRALEIWEQSLGEEHRTTRIGRSNYATLLQILGRGEESI